METFTSCKTGLCSKGTSCNKKHDLDFLKVKKGPCVIEYFNVDTCPFKNNCTFSHEIPDELRNDPCQKKKMSELEMKIGPGVSKFRVKPQSNNGGHMSPLPAGQSLGGLEHTGRNLDLSKVKKDPCMHEFFRTNSCPFGEQKCSFSHEITDDQKKDVSKRRHMEKLRQKKESGRTNQTTLKGGNNRELSIDQVNMPEENNFLGLFLRNLMTETIKMTKMGSGERSR